MTSADLLLIGGPTASGKSDLGVKLAHALNGEIVSLDSVQVYRGCDIGSAKLPLEERQGIPHHLLDCLDPAEVCDAAWFIAEAGRVIEEIQKRAKLPIIVGGSNLYLTVLLHGLADLPERDPKLRAELEALSIQERFQRLVELDPESAARLHPHDTTRVVRALEVVLASGHAVGRAHEHHGFKLQPHKALCLVLCASRTELYSRIDRRSQKLVEQGILKESEALLEAYGSEIPCFRAVGYSESLAALKGTLDAEELAMQIAQSTRRLAKRQMTYWRNEPTKRGWIVCPAANESAIFVGDEGEQLGKKGHQRKGFRAYQYNQKQLEDAVVERLKQPLVSSEVWYLHTF